MQSSEVSEPSSALATVPERECTEGEPWLLSGSSSAGTRAASGAQRVELVPLRLDQLVETTVEELPDHESVTVTAEPVVVRGDPDLLAQAVRNLVENALVMVRERRRDLESASVSPLRLRLN